LPDQRARAALIDSLAVLKTNAVRDYAVQTMKRGPDPTSRLAAARIASHWNPKAALEAMSQEWVAGRRVSGDFWTEDQLADFLAASKSTTALIAFTKRFPRQEFYHRARVIDALVKASSTSPLPAAYSAKLEGFLAEKLSDKSRGSDGSVWFEMATFVNPRICDLAAFALAKIWPTLYRYDFSATDRARDRQCRETENAWRRRRHLRALPPIAMRALPPTDEHRVQLILERSTRQGSLTSLEKFGPGAIGTVLEFERSLSPRDPARQAVHREAVRLGSIVCEVHLLNVPLRARTFAAKASALKGTVLNSKAIKSLIDQATAKWPPGAGGVAISVLRDPSGRGAILTLDLAAPKGGRSSAGGFNYEVVVTAAGKNYYTVSGASGPQLSGFDEVYEAIDAIAAEEPHIGYAAYISLARDK
jgi:hypothetical protein